MKPFLFTTLISLLAISFPAASQEAPIAVKGTENGEQVGELIDDLGQSSLQEAFRLLRSDYIKRESLSYLELNRAAFQGLLERLDFGAMLLTRAGREASDSPFAFHGEKLSEEIGYARFGKFRKEEVDELDKVLARFRDEPKMKTLILDLRSPQALADFEIASLILSRFRPGGELLFKIRRPNEERPRLFTSRPAPAGWDREIIVLIDRETGNAGEIIAAVLRDRNGSLLIGETTVGMTVEYRDVPVAEDRILRYAVAEVVLPDDTSLFQKGVAPDVVTEVSSKVKQAIFKSSEEESLSRFVFDRGRPKMNEAALVAGTDPELEYYVERSYGRETPWDKPMLRDRALRQAVDLLTAASFLMEPESEAKDEGEAGPPSGEKPEPSAGSGAQKPAGK